MSSLGSPEPEFYLSPGVPVTCLHFTQLQNKDLLLVGSSEGDIIVYDCKSWKKIYSAKVFMKGMLWLKTMRELPGDNQKNASDLPGDNGSNTLICQGRFESLKILEINFKSVDINDIENLNIDKSKNGELEILEKANFGISHEAFCKGFVDNEGETCLVFTPSSTCSLIINKLGDTYIRPVVTLNPERMFPGEKYGAIMCCAKFSASCVLVGYENSEIILWEWSSNKPLAKLKLAQCGTIMSLDCDMARKTAVVAGSENTVSVVRLTENNQLEILKDRVITNSGLGAVKLRPDKIILAAGGWDFRIRLFSWKYPEKLKPLAVLHFHTAAVEALAFTSKPINSGRFRKNVLAAGGKDGKVSVWSLYND